jgi:hypothetical protein
MTAEELITQVRQLAQLADVDSADAANPSAEPDTDEGILAIANREMRGKLLSDVMALREEFFVFKTDFTITQASASYRIPSRAIGAKLRDVVYVDGSNNVKPIPRLPPEDVIDQYRYGFYIQNNSVVLRSEDNTGVLRMSYFARPGKLVIQNRVATITVISSSTNITVTGDNGHLHPANPSPPNTLNFDIQKSTSPFEYVAVGKAASHPSAHVFSFAAGVPSGTSVGDTLELEDETNFVQLPEEAANVLVYRTAAKVLEAIGDESGLRRLSGSAKEMEQAMTILLSPRVDGKGQKVVNKTLFGNRWWR